MTKLTDEAKQAIITHLAQFRSQSETAKLVSAEFGVAVDRFQVRTYDPTSMRFAAGPKWADIFQAERKAHLTQIERVPSFHKPHRIARLDRMASKAEYSGNIVLAAALLEQIAKEVGDAYSNKRNLHHSGYVDRRDLSIEEVKAELAIRLAGLREREERSGRPSQTEH